MYQYIFNFIRLLDFDADSYAVDARFDEHFLVLIARDRERVQEDFRRAGCFYFWDIVSF